MDAAITPARIAMSMTMRDTLEWGTPVLHMRPSDGNLLCHQRRRRDLPGNDTIAATQTPNGDSGEARPNRNGR